MASSAVYCLVEDEPKANAILTALRAAGFTSEISVVLGQEVESRNISLREDAARGAKIGGVVGALLGLTIPGVGAALAIGPLVAALGGAAAGGIVGGLAGGSGALGGLALPAEVAERLKEGLAQGQILISIHTEDALALQRAADLFRSERAEFVYEEQKAA